MDRKTMMLLDQADAAGVDECPVCGSEIRNDERSTCRSCGEQLADVGVDDRAYAPTWSR